MLKLHLMAGRFAVCRLADADGVNWDDDFVFLGNTNHELSLVCPEGSVPAGSLRVETGWRALWVEGTRTIPLSSMMNGILDVLEGSEIHVGALSSCGTDFLLVKEEKLRQASIEVDGTGTLIC